MFHLRELRNTHAGRPGAVLGGGPSLPGDLAKVKAVYNNPVYIAVNEHAFYIGINDPDYLVFMDHPQSNSLLWQVLKDYAGIKVSAWLEYSDVEMEGLNYWNGPGSGIVACWVACFLGCNPVLLCGMDLYQGPEKYCHRREIYEYRSVFNITLDEHLKRWKAGFRRCSGIERVRAVSGPLVDVFGGMDGC